MDTRKLWDAINASDVPRVGAILGTVGVGRNAPTKMTDVLAAREGLRPVERRTRDRTWKCLRCQLVFASADQCGCNLCPSCCTESCGELFDVELGQFLSECGNCDR